MAQDSSCQDIQLGKHYIVVKVQVFSCWWNIAVSNLGPEAGVIFGTRSKAKNKQTNTSAV